VLRLRRLTLDGSCLLFSNHQEWLDSTGGCIDLLTSSDEAAKSYDATVTQLVGWYQDETLGGLQGSLDKMLKADPEFLLGRALALEVNLLGGLTAPRLNKSLEEKLAEFNELVDKKRPQASEQELLHAKVVNHWAKGELKQAVRVFEQLTTIYPEDIAALKMSQDTYFYLGQALPMRHSIANSLSKMNKEKNPLAGYAYGMFAFALEESNMYSQAEVQALKALERIPRDTWAIHNYAHCLEMQGKTEEGLKWMLDKQPDWAPCSSLASHQYWHTALFHINNNNFDEAVRLLDEEVIPRCKSSCSSLDMHDSCSMVYRMELVDLFGKVGQKSTVEPKSRWKALYDVCKQHKGDHLIGFNDAHYMMSFLGNDDLAMAREHIDSIESSSSSFGEVAPIVKPLLEAMYQFKLGNYANCADLLEPIRFEIIKIGGSHAQRDVFEQLLLVAALKSNKPYHNQLAQRMLSEREVFHGRQTVQTQLLAKA